MQHVQSKGTKNYSKNYDEDMLQKALEEGRKGATKKKVAEKYGIPRANLQFRLGSK